MYWRFSRQTRNRILRNSLLVILASVRALSQQTTKDLPELLIRANQSFFAGQYEQAAQAYETIIKISPQSVAAHNNLGICYGKLQKLPEAIDQFRAAISLDKNSPELRLNLA